MFVYMNMVGTFLVVASCQPDIIFNDDEGNVHVENFLRLGTGGRPAAHVVLIEDGEQVDQPGLLFP